MEQQKLTPEQEKRVADAKEAIDAVCDNYKVALVPSMTLTPFGSSGTIGIVPQKEDSRILVPKINEKKILGGG
jgi:hypothetical protein